MAFPEYEKLSHVRRTAAPSSGTNLPVIEEKDATDETAALYQRFRTHFGRPDVPGILKCFATHPPLLRGMMDLSESLLFSDGHLGRRHKEMIATFVSVQNTCPYCADSHGFFLRVHGGSADALSALQENDLQSESLNAAERLLLHFVEKINLSSHQIEEADIDLLREAGWTVEQISESVHITALFSTFNRVANAFGLKSQGLLDIYENGGNGHGDEGQKI